MFHLSFKSPLQNSLDSTVVFRYECCRYFSAHVAIPQKWINQLKDNSELIIMSPLNNNKSKISLNKLSCKSASQMFVKLKFETPTAEKRMKQAHFDSGTIRITYCIPFKVTKDTRLAIFQFKIIHHILPTNATLFRDSLVQQENCHLCPEKQTLKHLFVTCPSVHTFWDQFTLWWNEKNPNLVTLSEKEIIYGFTNDLPRNLGLNLCVIVAKYYIYTASRREEEYIWEAFLAFLKNHLEIERHKSKLQIRF